jgi:hypothetical protein
MLERDRKRGIRNAWILTLLGAVYIVLFNLLAVRTNLPEPEVKWRLGAEAFVPASSHYAEGYYLPVVEDEWREFGRGGGR